MVKPSKKREVIKSLRSKYKASLEGCCSVVNLTVRSWYNKSVRNDTEVIKALKVEIEKKPNRGFDYLYCRLVKQGYTWSRNKVLRIYREQGLVRRPKAHKRFPDELRKPLAKQHSLNEVWSIDFMSDNLMDGRSVRVLNIIDDCNRECLLAKGSLSYSAERLVRELDQVIETNGTPVFIRTDNGPEFHSNLYKRWCKQNNISRVYSQPGKPMQNGFIERFNRTFREDVLDLNLFMSLSQLNILAEKFTEDYNMNHPHKSLDRKSPKEFRKRKKPLRKKREIFKL